MNQDYGCFTSTSGQVIVVRDDPGPDGGLMVGFQSGAAFVALFRVDRVEAGRLRAALGRAIGESEEV